MNALDQRHQLIASANLVRAYAPGDGGRAWMAHLKLLEALKLEELAEVKPEALSMRQGELRQLRALIDMLTREGEDGST